MLAMSKEQPRAQDLSESHYLFHMLLRFILFPSYNLIELIQLITATPVLFSNYTGVIAVFIQAYTFVIAVICSLEKHC